MVRALLVGDSISRLRVKDNQLIGIPRDQVMQSHSAPCEDLDVVVLESTRGISLDDHVLRSLIAANTTLIVTDSRHLPSGILLPLYGTNNDGEVLHKQIGMSLPRRKRAWQQIVKAKISKQAEALPLDHINRKRLEMMIHNVRSGDARNHEAQAARIYWASLLKQPFRRISRHGDGLNGALDYGYAIVRAALARALISTGLHLSLGVHHSGRANHFALVDDLIEPLRPYVDLHIIRGPQVDEGLEPPHKQHILSLLNQPFQLSGQIGPFPNVLERYAESYKRYVFSEDDEIEMPETVVRESN